MSHMQRILAAAALAVLGACGLDSPESPTWIDDVAPILRANCVRCHSAPTLSDAPTYFRLDMYDDITVPDGDDNGDAPDLIKSGAPGVAIEIATRVEEKRMPPRFPLTDRQIEILTTWYEDDMPRGERPDNAEPTLDLIDDLEVASGRLVGEYTIEDADGDLVVGVLFARLGGADQVPVQLDLGSGRGTIRSDRLAAGTHDVYVELHDGVDIFTVELGSVEVAP